ncbi:MAG TPA: diguanylate cyclase [Clostridiales bacterium]|nr:diguanylate cyclase [Clostridiales bacterium]
MRARARTARIRRLIASLAVLVCAVGCATCFATALAASSESPFVSSTIELIRGKQVLVANADSRVDRQVTASMIFEAYRKEIYALAVVSIGSTAVFIGLLLKKNHQLRKDIAEIKERDEKIEYLTYHDKLTGLYNRTYLDGVIENIEVKNQVPTSVLLGDVNGLKLVNDVLGHAAGDLLLQGIARLLQQYCRPEDIIARQGGDEYVVVMPKTSKEEAARIHRSILDACEQHCVGLLPVHLSLGYGTKEKRRDSIRKALGDAERMMYEQKLMSSISQSNGVVENLEKYLEEKDPVAKQHGLRLWKHLSAMGDRLGLSGAEMENLRMLSRMHDIGKIVIGEAAAARSQHSAEDESLQIRSYPEMGFRIAISSQILYSIAEHILHQNEWWNGNGYPHGLQGEAIPLPSRMLTIANAYDVMTTDRPYRSALDSESAIRELEKSRGGQFDPNLLDVFISVIEDEARERTVNGPEGEGNGSS